MAHAKPRAPLTEAQQALAVKHIPFARSLSRPYRIKRPRHAADLESIAYLALSEAVRDYDAAGWPDFRKFLWYRINFRLKDAARKIEARDFRVGHQVDLDVIPRVGNFPDEGVPDGSGPVGWEHNEIDATESLIRRLPKAYANVCRPIYLHGKTQGETAEWLGLSQTRVSEIHTLAIARLRTLLSEAS